MNGMLDPEVFNEGIFGFHAQQAVEKGLKAWLSALDVLYPKGHDLSRLLSLLSAHGENVMDDWGWVELNPYAVRFRYEWPETQDIPLERPQLILRITPLLAHVERRIQELDEMPTPALTSRTDPWKDSDPPDPAG